MIFLFPMNNLSSVEEQPPSFPYWHYDREMNCLISWSVMRYDFVSNERKYQTLELLNSSYSPVRFLYYIFTAK